MRQTRYFVKDTLYSLPYSKYALRGKNAQKKDRSMADDPTIETPFRPDFAKMGGLVPAIAQDAANGEVLMMAWVNEEAWDATLATGEAHYFSRSRAKLWHKGESSGNVQHIHAVRLDCDSDTILFLIDQVGDAACHTGHRSCFYREFKNGTVSECSPVLFDPKEVYK